MTTFIKKATTTMAAAAMIGAMAVYAAPASAQIVDSGRGTSRIGELIVLDSLFNNRGDVDGLGRGTSRVGELIVLDGLFNRRGDVDGLGRGTSRVGELIVLDGLFSNRSNGGIF